MDKPEVQIGAKVKFLEAQLIAGIQSDKTQDLVIVKQFNAGDQQTGISVKNIAESIATSIKDLTKTGTTSGTTSGTEEVTASINWPAGVKEIVESLLVQISQVYLYVSRDKKTQKKTVEYAIGIGIKLDDDKKQELSRKPPFDLIQLEELFLKIWRTDNPKIVEEMGVIDFNQYLALPTEDKEQIDSGSQDKKEKK